MLQSGAAQAWVGWTRADALATLDDIARIAEAKGAPVHAVIFQTTDPDPPAPAHPVNCSGNDTDAA